MLVAQEVGEAAHLSLPTPVPSPDPGTPSCHCLPGLTPVPEFKPIRGGHGGGGAFDVIGQSERDSLHGRLPCADWPAR